MKSQIYSEYFDNKPESKILRKTHNQGEMVDLRQNRVAGSESEQKEQMTRVHGLTRGCRTARQLEKRHSAIDHQE